MASPKLMQVPIIPLDTSSVSTKLLSLAAEVLFDFPSRSKPNLSVICIDCTKRRSSRACDVDEDVDRLRRRP